MVALLEAYVIDNLNLARRFCGRPGGKKVCQMLLDQSYGAVDFMTNLMERQQTYTKKDIDQVYTQWEQVWRPHFKAMRDACPS